MVGGDVPSAIPCITDKKEIMNRTKKLIIPPINVIGKMIEMEDTSRWKGNCFCVASKIVDEPILLDDDCRAVYGHYLGPISSKSIFANRQHMPFVHHGWIVLSNGDIIDPTRWVFEAKDPYIAYFDSWDDIAVEEYDEGGNKWIKTNETPAPKYRKKDRQFPFVINDDEGKSYVIDLLSDDRKEVKEISLDQIFWLANLSLNTLGIYANVVYTYIKNMGQSCCIPIDNKMKILGKD